MKVVRLKLVHEGNLIEIPHINSMVSDLIQKVKQGGYEPTEVEITVNNKKANYLIELYAERRGAFKL